MAAAKKRTPQKASIPNQSAGVEASVRTFTTWTPALIRSAEAQADNGNLRAAANLCDWLFSDDRLQSTLHTRVQSLLGLNPTFEASGDKRRSAKVVRALEAQEDWWASYPETDLGPMVAWGVLFGIAILRHRWLPVEGHGGRLLPMPEFWHPCNLRMDNVSRKWLMKVQGEGLATSEVEVVPGDGAWILHTPYGSHRPWAFAPWRGLARMVLLKYYAISDWARHSEKAALLVATSEDDTSSEKARDKLASDIYNRGREGVCVLPPGFDLKLVQAVANTEALYQAQVAMADTAIAIAIRGGNLTTEVQAGSRAAAEAQERLGDETKRRFDGESVSTTLHDQSLNWWAGFNFGDKLLAPYVVYPTGPRRDLVGKANSIVAASGALQKFLEMGFELDDEGQGFIDEFELNGIIKKGPKPPALPVTAPKAPNPKTVTDPTVSE